MTPDLGLALLHDIGDDAGFSVEATSAGSARVTSRGVVRTARVRAAVVPPNPARVGRELLAVREGEALLYVTPRLTASLRQTALADPRLIVAAVDERTVVVDGAEWNGNEAAPRVSAPRGRKPWGRFGVIRALIRTGASRSQAQLAVESGVTQQSVALALKALAPLGVARDRHGWRAEEPSLLWDAFIRGYPGPGGLRRRWIGAADLATQVARALDVARETDLGVLVSGDAAADQQAPFRRPVTAALYATSHLDLSARFASATAEADDWTISVVVPEDPTVFATARAWARAGTSANQAVTDPVLTAWEVARSRGPERDEAVAALKSRVLGARDAE